MQESILGVTYTANPCIACWLPRELYAIGLHVSVGNASFQSSALTYSGTRLHMQRAESGSLVALHENSPSLAIFLPMLGTMGSEFVRH